MKRHLLIVACVLLAFLGTAIAEPAATQAEVYYELPADWISMEIGEQASQVGMVSNAISADGSIMLQVFMQKDSFLSDVKAMLDTMANAVDVVDAQTETMPYIAYSVDTIRCYAVQVEERNLLLLNLSVANETEMAQADEIVKGIVASISIVESKQ